MDEALTPPNHPQRISLLTFSCVRFLLSPLLPTRREKAHPNEPERFLAFTRRLIGSGRGTGVAFPGVQHIFTQASFLSVTDRVGDPLFPRIDFIGSYPLIPNPGIVSFRAPTSSGAKP